jgi:hypothetical protein
VEYWLDHVRVFASGAPTFIVLNKVDSLPSGIETILPFDINEIRRNYKFAEKDVFLLSCKTGVGLEKFASALRRRIAENIALRADMPSKWFEVKEVLSRENKDLVARERFNEICEEKGLVGDEIDTALKILDILGTAIYFPKLSNSDVVLNPEWITKAIYFIIWKSQRHELDGKLDVKTLQMLFAEGRVSKELDVEVPDDRCEFLLDLMEQFELAFKTDSARDKFCVPMLAAVEMPDHGIPREESLRFDFSLPFLPPGLFYRFIAESGQELYKL